MGDFAPRRSATMKFIVIVALLAAAALAHNEDVEEAISENAPDLVDEDPELEEDLESAVRHLKQLVPKELQRHTDELATHVAFIQEAKKKAKKVNLVEAPKAYKHNFSAARAAIKAALSALTSDLTSGHNHDSRMLSNARSAGVARIRETTRRNKARVTNFRHKACPTKRAEEGADKKKRAAQNAVNAIKKKQICNVATTWKAMGITTPTPKLGTAMYNKWTRNRADFVRKTAQYNAAAAAHKRARRAHAQAMTSFKVALNLEVKNTHRSCVNTGNDYKRLMRDVQGNVKMRKEVYIATLIVGCYADNLASNKSAGRCADVKRRADTRRWNIVMAAPQRCRSRNTLLSALGPANWQPTWANCAQHRRIYSEKQSKAAARKAAERRKKNQKPMPNRFTNCGQNGRFGPSQQQCDRTYGKGVVKVKKGIQLFKITKTCTYEFAIAGARGGRHCGGMGGYGAGLYYRVRLNEGDTMAIAVGQQGDPNPSCGDWGGGGGGGTFVAKITNSGGYMCTNIGALGKRGCPLALAGGGAGVNDRRNSGRAQGGRGVGGNLGAAQRGGYSGAGGGWLKRGMCTGACHASAPGYSFAGPQGPIGGGGNAHYGGFGGGGRPYNGGGGGGGAQGGACTIGGTDHDCYGGTTWAGNGGSIKGGPWPNSNNADGHVIVRSKC